MKIRIEIPNLYLKKLEERGIRQGRGRGGRTLWTYITNLIFEDLKKEGLL